MFFLFKYVVPKYTGFKNFYFLVSVLSFVVYKFLLVNFSFAQKIFLIWYILFENGSRVIFFSS